MESQLQLRKSMKTKRLEFERQGANDHRQFKGKWRRPKGLHSKMKVGLRGHPLSPRLGFASPSSVSGLTKSGYVPVLVSNLKDLEKIKKGDGAVIGSGVGMRKKLEILRNAKSKNIHVIGVKNLDEKITSLVLDFENRKKSRKMKEDKIQKKRQEAESKKDEKKLKEEKKDEPKK